VADLKEQNQQQLRELSTLRSKLDSSGFSEDEMQRLSTDNSSLKKQLSTCTAKLDNYTRELKMSQNALESSQGRVSTLTAAVAAAEEAAAEKWQAKLEAAQSVHKQQHAAATQAWHEHSTMRLQTLNHELAAQFSSQTEELTTRCARLEMVNEQLEATNSETLQAAEHAAQLANDLMAQLSESERLRAAEQTKFNAQVLTLKQGMRNLEREREATADHNHHLQQQLTKLNAQIDQYASLLEAEEDHHSLADRPETMTRLLTLAAPPGFPSSRLFQGKSFAKSATPSSSPSKPSPSYDIPRATIPSTASIPRPPGLHIGYGGLDAPPGVVPVSPAR
jgi:chromosome segregation ATPase